MELASRKNAHPLPLFDHQQQQQQRFHLPPDHQCLLAANYKITTMRNVPMQRPAPSGMLEDPTKRMRQA